VDVIEKEQLSFIEAQSHWYYVSKFNVMRRQVMAMDLPANSKLADFGCGAGLFLSMIVKDGLFPPENLFGVDTAYSSERRLPESGVMVGPSFPAQSQFDVVLLMDVLEHIKDAGLALRLAAKHCKPGGYLFVTLPALTALWSRHDEFLGHHRRYNLNDFAFLAGQDDTLAIEKLFYFFASILPVAAPVRWARRLLGRGERSDMRRAIPQADALLKTVLGWETSWMENNQTAGLSVVAVCRKRADS
jgi:SAM-dependent methyltransferase